MEDSSRHKSDASSSSAHQHRNQGSEGDKSGVSVRIHDLADYSSTLLFPAVREHHRGNYTCSASNVVGQDEHTSSLIISGQSPLSADVLFLRSD